MEEDYHGELLIGISEVGVGALLAEAEDCVEVPAGLLLAVGHGQGSDPIRNPNPITINRMNRSEPSKKKNK